MRAIIDLPEPFDHFVAVDGKGEPAWCACGATDDLASHLASTRPPNDD